MADALPLRTSIQRLPIPLDVKEKLNERLVLVFTGQPSLTKNILQNVLRRWGRRNPEIVRTVSELVSGVKAAARAVQDGDLGELGRCLYSYWLRKKKMAGGDGGAERIDELRGHHRRDTLRRW